MTELVQLADKNGWLIVVIILAAWKFIPAIADKLAPEWMAAKREADASRRASLESVYAKMVAVIESNSRFVSAAAMSINGLERALDGNTQQLARITEIVRHGPSCPLPECPFMASQKET